MSQTEQLIKKFYDGDFLSNNDIDILIKKHRNAIEGLDGFGPTFELAVSRLRHDLTTLEDYYYARKRYNFS